MIHDNPRSIQYNTWNIISYMQWGTGTDVSGITFDPLDSSLGSCYVCCVACPGCMVRNQLVYNNHPREDVVSPLNSRARVWLGVGYIP